jgi:hypothetical protein
MYVKTKTRAGDDAIRLFEWLWNVLDTYCELGNVFSATCWLAKPVLDAIGDPPPPVGAPGAFELSYASLRCR